MRKSCFRTSIYSANSKLLRCCNVQSEFSPLIAGALCTRIVARFLQVFQTFWASSYKVTLSATFVTSAFIALCIWTFLHSMSILVAVITQTRVLSCAFFDSTLVFPPSDDVTNTAILPFSELTVLNWTFSPSSSLRYPLDLIALWKIQRWFH